MVKGISDYHDYLSPTYKPNAEVTKKQHKGKMWAVKQQIGVKLNRIAHFLKTLFTRGQSSEWINNKFVMNQIQKDISVMQGRINEIKGFIKSSKNEGESIHDIHKNIQEMRVICDHLKLITISSKKDQQLLGKVEQQIDSLETAVPNIQTLAIEQLNAVNTYFKEENPSFETPDVSDLSGEDLVKAVESQIKDIENLKSHGLNVMHSKLAPHKEKLESLLKQLKAFNKSLEDLVKSREPLGELVTDQEREVIKANVKKLVKEFAPGLNKDEIPEYQSMVKSLQELYKPRSERFSKTANTIAEVADIESPNQPSAILAQTALRILQSAEEQSPPSVESEVAVVSPEQDKLNEQRKEIEGDIIELYERVVTVHSKATFLTDVHKAKLSELVNQDFSGLSLKELKEKVFEIENYVGKVLDDHTKAGKQTEEDRNLDDDFFEMTAGICKRIDDLIEARGTEEVVKDKPEELEEMGKITLSVIDSEIERATLDTLDWDIPTSNTISDQFQSLLSTIKSHQPNYFSEEDLSKLETLVDKDLSKMGPRDLMDHLHDIGNLLSDIYDNIPVPMGYAAYKENQHNEMLDKKLSAILSSIENDIERISRDQSM